MARGLWFVALAAGALASVGAQASSEAAKPEHTHANAVAPVAADKYAADAANEQRKGCPGTQYPRLNCDAISAQTNLEQARQSERQTAQIVRQIDLFRVELIISALTMVAAFAAAVFAARAATAARATVKAFVEVEQADIFITLENFAFSNVFVRFNIVVNNLGRSTALIETFAKRWMNSAEDSAVGIFMGDSSPRIVPAGGRLTLERDVIREMGELKSNGQYLWVLVRTQSPLRGELRIRSCYEIFASFSGPYHQGYRTRRLDHIDGQSRIIKTTELGKSAHSRPPFWRRLRGTILVRRGYNPL